MSNLPQLIAVTCKSKITYYIERKKNDFRPSYVIVKEYKLNLINSKLQVAKKEKSNKLFNF